jgi:hypothetical protein
MTKNQPARPSTLAWSHHICGIVNSSPQALRVVALLEHEVDLRLADDSQDKFAARPGVRAR